MGVQLYANNCATTLAAPCSNVATELTLTDGSNFPSPSGGDWFLLTLYQLSGAQETNYEIVKVTARSGDVLTVVRAFEDAVRFPARSFTAGDFAELRMTAGSKGLASQIINVPAGNISATDVQAAIAELDAEKQPIDPELTALAGLTSAADKGIQFTGSGTAATFDLTTAGKALLDDADAAAQRTTLGLGTAALLTADTDVTLAANSDTRAATQKATKAYIDALLAAQDVLVFKGAVDCSANPNYPAASAGHFYKISVAGKIGGASGPVVQSGDSMYCITDSSAGGTHASVGADWVIVQVNIDGAVVGPASAGDSKVALFDGATGKLIKDSGLTLAGTNTGDETATTTGALINGATAKTTPVDADYVGLMDSAASNILKKLSWANIKATLKTYFDTLYAGFGANTFTGNQTYQADLIESPAVANTSTAYTVTGRSFHDLTLTGNCAFTFPTATAGKQFTLLLKQDGTGSRTVTWPSSVRWASGTAPTITATASKTDVISFVADGTYWLGFVGGQNYTRA